MYKQILVPTDGSETAMKAAGHAISIAKSFKTKLACFYVIDISGFAGIPTDAIWESMRALLEDEGMKALEAIKDRAKAEGVECETAIREGVPAEDIVKYAEEINSDLVVMGTAGRTGIDRFLLGSVAEKVIRTAPCPVLIVHK